MTDHPFPMADAFAPADDAFAMNDRPIPQRTGRSWLIASSALATWVQPVVLMRTTAPWWLITLWGLCIALSALPLVITSPPVFRRACLTVGGVVLATQIALAAPYLLTPLPYTLTLFPAGLLLLLAGWKRFALTRGTLAALLLVIPALGAFATLFPPH